VTGGGRPPANPRRSRLVILIAILASLVVVGYILVALQSGIFF
jgi:cytochrome c-type biogenesis protein CcmE